MARKIDDSKTTQEDKTTSASTAESADEQDQQRELEETRARAEEHYRSWQRSAADFANFKRRVDEEKRFAERWLIQDLLSLLDDFDRAWATAPRELHKLTWMEGLLQINSKLFGVLQRHGVTPIEAQDQPFDPLQHEAVMRDEDGDVSEQSMVVLELQRGYRLHDRVIRPALVKVGKPATPASEQAKGGEATETV